MLTNIIPVLLLAGSQPAAVGPTHLVNCAESSEAVLKRFLNYEIDGYRLGSKGHEALWDLTDRSAEHDGWPIVVTKDYKILSAFRVNSNTCQYNVVFRVFGISFDEDDDGVKLRSIPKADEKVRLTVHCKENCLIDISDKQFNMSLHPGKKAVLDWLEQLRDIQNGQAAKFRMKQYFNLVSALR